MIPLSAIHVCVVTTSPHVFGAEKSMATLAAGLREKGVRVSVVSPGGECERLFESAGIPSLGRVALGRFVRPRAPGQVLDLGGLWVSGAYALAREFAKSRPDVLHANGIQAALHCAPVSRVLGVPLVWHVRDYSPNRWATGLCARAAHAIILPSRSLALDYSRWRGKLVHIPNPVDPHRLESPSSAPHAEETEGANGDHGRDASPSANVVIALVGQMIPRKGHMVLLGALSRLGRAGASIRVLFAGDDPFCPNSNYARALRARVESIPGLRNRVSFLGYVKDTSAIYSRASLVVIPSLAEPFGRVALEAMASRRPVIASRTGGLAEIIRDGWNGLLFNPGDAENLAACIRRLLDNPSLGERLVENGMRAFEANLQVQEISSDKVAALYGKLCRRRRERQRQWIRSTR